MRDMSIMLVEDDLDFRAGLSRALARKGARVVAEATTLAEAREALGSPAPDLVLVDFGLPDGVGLELVREMTTAASTARCVLMSMHDDPAYHVEAEAAGALGFAPKHRLWEALERLLAV
ncbi:MAG: hypothetical protein SangKO_052600 [Sandaracinaceae bacterium]|nr:MAG: response regulator transcription factor [Sandaracinaceae bacterium]HBQ18867.1 hypothetical protein [Myxococcales bacterium]